MKQEWMAGMIVFVLAVVMLGAGSAAGAEGARHTLTAGTTLTGGNSETLLVNAGLLTEAEREGLGSIRAGVAGNYGESKVDGQDEVSVENARLFANTKKTISARTFVLLDGSLFYDAIAQVDYRAIIAPGLGVYLIKRDNTSLFVEGGPAYLWERVGGERDDYLAFRLAQRIDHALSPTSRIWQSLEYLPKADAFDDYLLNAEVGVEAGMTERLNARLVLQNQYDSTPGPDLKTNDYILIAGVSVSL